VTALEILAVIGIVGYIIYRQVQGEPLRGKRAVLLPAVLTVIGFVNLRGGGTHPAGADIACLIVGLAGSAAIGLAFGTVTRLEERGGYLWAQLPLRGLWLWAALAGWRVAVMAAASGLHAHVAASSATLLLSLGVNRLAQAAVIVARALRMGVPFAPEKDGRVFMAGTMTGDRARPGYDGRRFDFDGSGYPGHDGRTQGSRRGPGGYRPRDGYRPLDGPGPPDDGGRGAAGRPPRHGRR
jgi:hypothetical protein